MAREVFDLASLFERDAVKRKDGTELEVRNKQELSMLQRHQIDSLILQINELDAKPDKTEADAAQGSLLLHELAVVALVDPPDDLDDWECAATFAFWFARATRDLELAPPPPKGRSTKRSSSRGSKSSTAAPRKRGSTRRAGS